MSKKRPKKHYRPRAVAVPPFLATMQSFGDNVDHRENDRVYLLRVANRTATEEDGLIHVRLMQVAWILAARMENARALRECLRDGILAVGYYSDPKGELEFTQEHFEQLSAAVETCRGILDNSGHLERAQAMTAVLDKNVLVGVDDKPVTDGEIRL